LHFSSDAEGDGGENADQGHDDQQLDQTESF
jgi:hypothetical protein